MGWRRPTGSGTLAAVQRVSEERHVFNIDVARIMHKHGDDWVEMSPVADWSPDGHDPERKLLAGQRAFRCHACDEEIAIRFTGPDE